MNATDAQVLAVCVGQSPDYPIHPNATAFAVEGLAAGDVEAALLRLHRSGHVEHVVQIAQEERVVTREARRPLSRKKFQEPVLDEDGNHQIEIVDVIGDDGEPLVLDHGFVITDAGRKSVGKRS